MDWARAVSILRALETLPLPLRQYRQSLLGIFVTERDFVSCADGLRTRMKEAQQKIDRTIDSVAANFKTEACFVCKKEDKDNKRCSGCRQVTCMLMCTWVLT